MTKGITIATAAGLLGVSEATVLDLINDGLLPGASRRAGDWDIPLVAVQDLVTDRERVNRRAADDPYALPRFRRHSARLGRG